MPKTYTAAGNYAQTLAYKALCAPVTEVRQAKRTKRRLASPVAPTPWAPKISRRERERAEQLQRIALRKAAKNESR